MRSYSTNKQVPGETRLWFRIKNIVSAAVTFAIFFSTGFAAADVMDIGPDGTVAVHNTPGLYQETIPAQPKVPILRARAPDSQINLLLNSAADRYAIDPVLLTAVARRESGFRKEAVSSKGAVGVMQLMDRTARGLGIDRFDPSQNILGGAAYLRQMLDRYGDTSLAVAAYNAGPGAVDAHHGIPPFAETQEYVRAILQTAPIQSVSRSVLVINR